MFKTFALASLLSTVAYAQSSASTYATASANATASATSSATPVATANPLIPTGLSTGCSTFLTGLNSDSNFTTCLNTLTSATSAFAPGSNSTASSAAVSSALTGLCSSTVDTACPESNIRTQLTNFFTACSAELTTSNVTDVVKIYDVLYSFLPMRTAACAKADDGSWCVNAPTTTSREVSEDVAGDGSSLSVSSLLALLYTDNSALKRRDSVSAIVPNTTTYHDTYLPFIFFKPTLDATTLCTSCARQVLTAYIDFESNIPYAPGLSSSQILSSQSDLYNAVESKCGSTFLTGAVQAAGGLGSSSVFGSAAVPAANSESKMIIAAAMGALTLAISFSF
ncbi:hypothetical protein HYPSUDRAFT_65260 [Hypholoma sublateritium FD-334 SS-4]|uniref:Uncharacterized protein n=1 Tax=Hypholoma sublateritium (strain FD-334 SS-4) TaxID=945553 RepID=A0A0D2Q056_HYPSF|nr:hypothetical protein HYPSUDRAFT_65260 [Hypholoma sublateritium FD-334 SS-4]